MLQKNGLLSVTRLMKAIVRSSVFKKQRKKTLILLSSETLLQEDLINSLLLLRWVPRGVIVCWNGSLFDGSVVDIQHFAITISFSSRLDMNLWNLTAVYGPCLEPARTGFVNWLRNLDIQDDLN